MTGLLLLALAGASTTAPMREIRVLMGTTAEVQAWGAPKPTAALDAAFDALAAVDEAMSLWKESPLVRLNREGTLEVPPDLLVVLRTAFDIAAATDGAFDPTV